MPHNILTRMAMKKFAECLKSEFAEEFLEAVLGFMKVLFMVDHDFRRNISGFDGRYLFKSRDGSITVAAIFRDNEMDVREEVIPDPNITVIFKDSKALMNYLLAPKPDVLGSMLRQEVTLEGNLNYLYKFAFMAKRLQLMVTGGI
jgi:hypothetical protein